MTIQKKPPNLVALLLTMFILVTFSRADSDELQGVASLEGKVFESSTGAPLESTNIIVIEPTEMEVRITTIRSSIDGSYQILLTQSGIKKIIVCRRGFTPIRLTIDITHEGQRQDFYLLRAATVAGVITDSLSRPVEGAPVELEYIEKPDFPLSLENVGGHLETTSSGNYLLRDIEAGREFRLRVRHPDYKEYRSSSIVLMADEQITLNIILAR